MILRYLERELFALRIAGQRGRPLIIAKLALHIDAMIQRIKMIVDIFLCYVDACEKRIVQIDVFNVLVRRVVKIEIDLLALVELEAVGLDAFAYRI